MALGVHLVEELGYADGVDTLGRWMSHHLAELINKAENGSKQEKKKASAEAVDIILKIWEHRVSLPGNAYPLSRFKDIISVLDTLRPDANFWERNGLTRLDGLAANLYDDFRLLIVGLLGANLEMLKEENQSQPPEGPLSEDEQRLLDALNIFSGTHISTAQESGEKKPVATDEIPPIVDLLPQLVDKISGHLEDLKAELPDQKKGNLKEKQ